MHSSKGLEFDKVFLIDMVQNQIPGHKAIEMLGLGEISIIEEERRLCYVAMTRAKRNLFVMTIKSRNDQPLMKSIFVDEIENIINANKI